MFTKISKETLLLIFLFFIGLGLRLYLLDQNLFFNYEQGRDLLVVKDIVENHKLTLIGPKTDIDGVFHGPLYYYLLFPLYLLFSGNPILMSQCLNVLISFTVIPLFFLAKKLFDKQTAWVAAIFWTFSYGAIISSHWFANPVFMPLLSVLFWWLILKYKESHSIFYILYSMFCLAAVIHLEIVNALFLIPAVLLYFRLNKIKIPMRHLIISCLLLVVSCASYALFELRHEFLMTHSLLNALGKTEPTSWLASLKQILGLLNDQVRYYFFTSINHSFYWLVYFIFLIVAWKKDHTRLLFLWLSVPIFIIFFLPRFALFHFFLGIYPALFIAAAVILREIKIIKIIKVITIITFIVSHLLLWQKNLPLNRFAFFQAGQEGMKISEQIKTIDYLYQQTKKESWSAEFYTIPYFSDQGWRYLLSWYGQKKYGYLPITNGEKTRHFFLVYQEDLGQSWYLNYWLKQKDKTTSLLETRKFGIITVEKRQSL